MRELMKKILIVILALLSLTQPAIAKQYGFKNIIISDLWARPTIGKMENSAIYLVLINEGQKSDFLINAETDVARKIEIHKTISNNDISSMVHINKVAIPGKTTVKFSPGGLHIMILGVAKELREGDKFPLSLTFEYAGKIEVEVLVQKK
jgi:copper(I)-binding protein